MPGTLPVSPGLTGVEEPTFGKRSNDHQSPFQRSERVLTVLTRDDHNSCFTVISSWLATNLAWVEGVVLTVLIGEGDRTIRVNNEAAAFWISLSTATHLV